MELSIAGSIADCALFGRGALQPQKGIWHVIFCPKNNCSSCPNKTLLASNYKRHSNMMRNHCCEAGVRPESSRSRRLPCFCARFLDVTQGLHIRSCACSSKRRLLSNISCKKRFCKTLCLRKGSTGVSVESAGQEPCGRIFAESVDVISSYKLLGKSVRNCATSSLICSWPAFDVPSPRRATTKRDSPSTFNTHAEPQPERSDRPKVRSGFTFFV